MALEPAPFSKDDLLTILRLMVVHIEQNDSFEGSIEYLQDGPPCSFCRGQGHDERGPCGSCGGSGGELLPEGAHFWVQGAFRVGNSLGQGGMKIVGKMVNG